MRLSRKLRILHVDTNCLQRSDFFADELPFTLDFRAFAPQLAALIPMASSARNITLSFASIAAPSLHTTATMHDIEQMFAAEDGNTKEFVMNKTVRNFVVLVVFAMALTGLSLAQDDTYRVTANIPFDFYAGDQQLPAGTYQFDVSYGTHTVMLRNHDSGRSYMVIARACDGEGLSGAMLEFDVVSGNHLLADLKTASTGVNFSESKTLLASAQRGGSVTIVAALR